MLNRLEHLTLRVGGSNELIDQWLQSRKQLLVAYCALVGIKPNKEKHTPLNEKALENFCHNLVDYLSAGHFHVYDRIVELVGGDDSPHMAVTKKIYPALHDNTKLIMAFHDRFTDDELNEEECLALHDALSHIGETLAARFALEDNLIQIAYDIWQANTPAADNDDSLARPA